MATDKPRIQAFLEPEVYQALTDWQQKRGIPKNSEAVNQILKEYFGLSAESPNFASSPNSEELRLLIQEELWGAGKFDFIDGLRAEAQAIIAKEVTEAKEYWQALDLKETIARQQAQIEVLVYHVKQLEEICKPIEGLAELSKPLQRDDIKAVSETPSDSPSELNLSQLARHLKVSKSVVSRRKTQTDFERWSRSKDPAGTTWAYDPGRQIFRGAAL